MDYLPGFAWIKDIEGRYVYINESLRQLRNAVGKTDAELWPAEIAATYRANDNQVIQTKHALQTKEPFPKVPEHGFHIVSKFPIFDQDGAVVMVGGASVDISELIQAEKALEAQALRYKTLMETSTESIYVVDNKGNLREANAAFLQRRGYASANVGRLSVVDWDAGPKEEALLRVRKLLDSAGTFETLHRCRDGSVFDVEVAATGVRVGGEQLIFCVARDISERKRTEERLREYEKVVEGLEEMIVVVDRDYRYLLANRAFLKARGMEADAVVGRPVAEVLNSDIFENVVKEKLDRCLGGETIRYEMKYRYPDRGERDLFLSYFPIEGPTGIDRVACVLQDITERKQAHEQLRDLSRRLLQVQEEERRHLARELHDEIGQTLTAVKINLAPGTAEAGTSSARLEEATALVDNLIRQVRQISLDLHPSLLDDLGLAPALRSLLEQQTRRAGLRAQFSAAEPLEEIGRELQTTAFRIGQEAITNVLRHASAKFIGLSVETDAKQLRMKIVDDGVGFDIAKINDGTTKRATFGLTGMKERAALLGGKVSIISLPGQGTTVEALLPLGENGSA